MAKRDLLRVERAARDTDRARELLHGAIVTAYEAGETMQDIATAAGLSRQRVSQILAERR
jgi:DNA-binding transcriptional regulator LsrR (DeoR family)